VSVAEKIMGLTQVLSMSSGSAASVNTLCLKGSRWRSFLLPIATETLLKAYCPRSSTVGLLDSSTEPERFASQPARLGTADHRTGETTDRPFC
jgi:hypothetical protein